jgi:hypothetical protein
MLEFNAIYQTAEKSKIYKESEDLSKWIGLPLAGLAYLGGIASLIALSEAEWHYEDTMGREVYSDRRGLLGTDYYVRDDEGKPIPVPDSAVRRVPDNWEGENLDVFITTAFVGIGGGSLLTMSSLLGENR